MTDALQRITAYLRERKGMMAESETPRTDLCMTTLADKYPKEQARLRELLEAYKEIPAGAFGYASIKRVLERADIASATHDTVEMLRCLQEMEECQ